MNHEDHARLIRDGVPAGAGQVWADFGSGWGAFTLALRDVAGADVTIWSIDRDAGALRAQAAAMAERFPGTDLRSVAADFTRPLDLPPLDGIVAANAIHFARDQAALLAGWRAYLKPGGRLVVVEYELERPLPWVPHPAGFRELAALAAASGFASPVRLAVHQGRRGADIYAALLAASPHVSSANPTPSYRRLTADGYRLTAHTHGVRPTAGMGSTLAR